MGAREAGVRSSGHTAALGCNTSRVYWFLTFCLSGLGELFALFCLFVFGLFFFFLIAGFGVLSVLSSHILTPGFVLSFCS